MQTMRQKSKALLWGTLIFLLPFPGVGLAAAQTFNAASAFSLSSHPKGVWRAGFSATPGGPLDTLDTTTSPRTWGHPNWASWRAHSGGDDPPRGVYHPGATHSTPGTVNRLAMHRPDLNSLPAAQRTQLAQLIQQYATSAIVNQHLNAPPAVDSSGAVFLSWHRTYLAGLENFLVAQGHPEWSPLPKWNPANPIPAEFNLPNAGPDRLRDLTPNISFSPLFDQANLDNFETDEDLGRALMGPHDAVHETVGGVMATVRAPAAPLFWPWHSFIDDIWWDWQTTTVVTPDCVGLTVTQARTLLTRVGLTVGTVPTPPHLHFPGDFPFPGPPRFQPPGFPPGSFSWPPRSPVRPRPHRHVVVDQFPVAGDRVHQGVAVDLILGMPWR